MNKDRTMETQSLHLTGVSNGRTLAGYRTQDGRTIRPHKLLRTGMLAKATPQDIDILVNREHLGMIIDLRTTTEIKAGEDPAIEGVSWHNIHVSDEQLDQGVNDAMTRMYEGDPITALIEMVKQGIMNEDIYIRFVQSEVSQKGFAQFFQLLLTLREDQAVLWHCTGGKDRAGTAAVLLLHVLGVDEESIMHDFEMTNTFNAAMIAKMEEEMRKRTDDPDVMEAAVAIAGVNGSWMRRMIDYLKEEYGSVVNYIEKVLHVSKKDMETLQNMFLK